MTVSIQRPFALCSLGIALLWVGPVAQAGESSSTTITVKVTIMAPPPCIINSNRTITVDFGDDVVIPLIDGSYKKRPVQYSLDCSEKTSNALQMQVAGLPGFDGLSLKTSQRGLGVALTRDGKRLILNSPFDFDADKKPVLEAVLVKQSGATLSGGAFSAGATLKVDYR